MVTYEYVIIGASAGGLAAAREIRRFDFSGSILMLSDERYPAYSRPLIARHISLGMTVATMQQAPTAFYQDQGIDLRLATRAIRIDPHARTVSLDDGSCVSWHQLLIATGSIPTIPEIRGINRRGVFTFATYHDAQEISRRLPLVRSAVVIGGGFIGLSAADALRTRGVDVTIVEMQPRLLNTVLDPEGSSAVYQAAIASGVRIITDTRVMSINGDHPQSDAVSSVTLSNYARIPCELVILAVGVKPRTELAQGIVSIDRGIVVDNSMRTSIPSMFACGDVCQTYDLARGRDAVLPIWPNAVASGSVAGAVMAGEHRVYGGGTTFNAIPYFGVSVASAGIVEYDPAVHDYVTSRGPGYYRKVIFRDDTVVGIVAVGDTTKFGLLHLLLKRKVNVEGWKDILVQEDFGLLFLPETLWRNELTAIS